MASVSVTVSTAVEAPRSAFFEWLVPGLFYTRLDAALQDAAGLPGVLRTSGTTGPWDVPGSYRTVHTTDGHTARDEVTGADGPDRFSYRVTEFSNPLLRRMIKEARGEWWFFEDGAKRTHAMWTYTFDATSALVLPILVPLIKIGWRRYMQAAIERVRTLALAEIPDGSRAPRWDFDLEALHGPQEMTEEDRMYRGSRWSEVREALFANPYRGGASGEQPGPLPMFRSTIANVWSGVFGDGPDHFRAASARSLDSKADLRWGPDGRGWRRVISPNGICLLGTWEITEDSPYSGYFAKGSKGLIVGRYSSDGNETKRGQRRSLSLAGKVYPTTDPDHLDPLVPANFMAQEDLGGMKTPYMNDALMTNAPNATAYRRGIYFLIMVRAGMVFTSLDKVPDSRQLYELSSLGVPAGQPVRTPQFMELQMSPGQRRMQGHELDFRDEVYQHLFTHRAPDERGSIEFDIRVSDTGTTSGVPGFRRVAVSDWQRIGKIVFTECVASYNGDHVIQFHHTGWRTDADDPSTAVRVNEQRVIQ